MFSLIMNMRARSIIYGLFSLHSITIYAANTIILPPNLIYDDAYTWLSAENHRDTQNGKPVDNGWSLKSQIRMQGKASEHSAFKVIVLKDNQELYSTRCEAERYINDGKVYNQRPTTLWHNHCQDKEQRIKRSGLMDVEIYFIAGSKDIEHLVRRYKIDVRKVDRVRGNDEDDSPDYYISRHGDVVSSTLYLRPKGFESYIEKRRSETFTYNSVDIIWNASTNDKRGNIRSGGHARCTVDGKSIKLGDPKGRNQDLISNDEVRFYEVTHTDRNAVEYHRGSPYKESIRFSQFVARLPLTWGKKDQPAHMDDTRHDMTSLDEHPGRWECQWVMNGEMIRTWSWVVNTDGSITPHDEEAQGLSFGSNAHLIETKIPSSGSLIDARLVPEQVQKSAFYGRPWKTTSGKAMSSSVPNKGNPWPVSSGPKVAKKDPYAEDKKRRAKIKADKKAAKAKAKAKRDADRLEAKRKAEIERAKAQAKKQAMAEARQKAIDEAKAQAQAAAQRAVEEAMKRAGQY